MSPDLSGRIEDQRNEMELIPSPACAGLKKY